MRFVLALLIIMALVYARKLQKAQNFTILRTFEVDG